MEKREHSTCVYCTLKLHLTVCTPVSPGIKIVQQIAILMGCAVLPHLKSLVEIVENGLVDEQQKVRTITALSLAALAEAATPYGIEAFDSVLVRLWKGIRYVWKTELHLYIHCTMYTLSSFSSPPTQIMYMYIIHLSLLRSFSHLLSLFLPPSSLFSPALSLSPPPSSSLPLPPSLLISSPSLALPYLSPELIEARVWLPS